MAVDTAAKRYSMIGFLQPLKRMLPIPDGGFSTQEDRQQLEYLYAFVFTPSVVTYFQGLTTSIRLTGAGR